MISLVSLICEDQNLPAVPPKSDVPDEARVNADLENIKQKFAECLNIDSSEVRVKKSEKRSIGDYGDLSMTGDILISCPKVQEIGAQQVADLLNRFGFLESIDINGQSGKYLSAIVFGHTRRHGGGGNPLSMMLGMSGMGDMAGGDVIITSHNTEMLFVPFLGRMGMNTANCEDAVMQYWDAIGGKVISDVEIENFQRQLAMSLRPRLGTRMMGRIGGGNPRQLPGGRRR